MCKFPLVCKVGNEIKKRSYILMFSACSFCEKNHRLQSLMFSPTCYFLHSIKHRPNKWQKSTRLNLGSLKLKKKTQEHKLFLVLHCFKSLSLLYWEEQVWQKHGCWKSIKLSKKDSKGEHKLNSKSSVSKRCREKVGILAGKKAVQIAPFPVIKRESIPIFYTLLNPLYASTGVHL